MAQFIHPFRVKAAIDNLAGRIEITHAAAGAQDKKRAAGITAARASLT
jgi:hypothetical protein